jgi:hypothetical protein
MLDFFFPRAGGGTAEDRIFVHIPSEVRGPIVSGWGIRGPKTALRDTDEKTRLAVEDALAAGDIDEVAFENGLAPQVLVDWAPLGEWWSFWRAGKLTGVAVQKALATARELALFDDRWFLQNCEGRGGKLKGTDTLCDTLAKDQVIAWMRRVHESGDGSPSGLVAALGWDTILGKTSQEALLFALDALARKVGLTTGDAKVADDDVAVPELPAIDAGLEALDPADDDALWSSVSSRHAPPPSSPPVVHVPPAEPPKPVPPAQPVPSARKRL